MAAVGTEVLHSGSRRQPAPRRRLPLHRRFLKASGPYALILPSVAIIVLVLAYPVYKLFSLSFHTYQLPQLIHESHAKLGKAPVNVGFSNYKSVFKDHQFWTVLWRTVLFTVANVGATMIIGTGLGVLLTRLSKVIRIALSVVLILVWATPGIVSITIWNWLFDQQFGVVNYALTKLHLGNFIQHDWYTSSLQGFFVITCVVVWSAIPFVAITMQAALTQVPDELIEAARVDGATGAQIFRRITFPILRPIMVIITSLSIIWDFQVFTQVYILRYNRPEPWYYLLSVFSFVESFKVHNFGLGAALSVIVMLILACVSVFYIRQIVRIGEAR
ncbi:MAG: carbohydrate ABC transporter permease [Acidothermaceae bacterium]